MRAAIRAGWSFLAKPSWRFSAGALLLAGIVVGVVGWGGFNWALELTNTEQFCVSCHEMRDTVYQDLQKTIHWSNRTGVRATCPDCHVPHPWIYKVQRKIQATNELYHKIVGTVNTPEKFEAHRLELAKDVWAAMKATDSRECRNCHAMQSMDFERQQPRSRGSHQSALKDGNTCIDCHKGIAHKPVHQLLEKEKPASSEENFDVN